MKLTVQQVKEEKPMNNIEYAAVEILLTTCSDCKEGENILIVSDPTSYPVAEKMWAGMGRFPKKSIVLMDERTMHGQQPNEMVASAMYEADVIFGCTKFSLFHTQARREAVANGARFINMADYDVSMLKAGGLFCDFVEVGKKCSRMAELLENKAECKIVADNGTSFTCSIKDRKPVPQYARSLRSGESTSPPDIECATCAVEGSAQGIIYIDGSIPHPRLGLIHDEIRLEIKDGFIVKITGGKQAETLKEVMEGFNDPNVFNVGEIGFGLNDKCSLNGRMLEDEGCGGTVHIGCGDNRGFGGVVASDYHLDLVFKTPTVYIDGEKVYNKGEVC